MSQAQLWKSDIAREFGGGDVADIISVDISNWDGVGITTVGKSAKQCTREEIFDEVWSTLKQRFGRFDRALVDANVHSWFLDPAISWGADGRVRNAEPLTVQTVGTWAKRPKGPTAVPNLFVAGDWIQTNANVVSMEGANQAGRIVAQAILDSAGSGAADVVRYDYFVPPQIAPLQQLDAQRFAAGQPNWGGRSRHRAAASYGTVEATSQPLRFVEVGPGPADDLPTCITQRILTPFFRVDGVTGRLAFPQQPAVLESAVEFAEHAFVRKAEIGPPQ